MSGARAVRDGVCAPTSAREDRAGGRRWLSRERLELEVTAISTGKCRLINHRIIGVKKFTNQNTSLEEKILKMTGFVKAALSLLEPRP